MVHLGLGGLQVERTGRINRGSSSSSHFCLFILKLLTVYFSRATLEELYGVTEKRSWESNLSNARSLIKACVGAATDDTCCKTKCPSPITQRRCILYTLLSVCFTLQRVSGSGAVAHAARRIVRIHQDEPGACHYPTRCVGESD